MKSIVTVINESSLVELKSRAELINSRIDKADEYILRQRTRLEKLFDKYKRTKELHAIVPYEIFINFQVREFSQVSDILSQAGLKFDRFSFVQRYNPEAYILYMQNKGRDTEAAAQLMWVYLDPAANYFKAILNKQDELETQKQKLEDISDRMAKTEQLLVASQTLLEQVPELDQFIDKCGERQYEFMIRQNEALKKAWDKYTKANEEANRYYQTSTDPQVEKNRKYSTMMQSNKTLMPHFSVRTEQRIREDVESWKRNERLLLASRINTEFGKIIKCSLYLGVDGNVNGTIEGSLKTAKIETIWAGGYNIQCLHVRLLVHEK